MLLWSHQLEDMGNFLRQDAPLRYDARLPLDRQSAEFQKARRLIQNNMDACRYTAVISVRFMLLLRIYLTRFARPSG